MVRRLGLALAVLFLLAVVSVVSAAGTVGLAPITGALEQANTEARGPILTAVSAILAVFVMISIGAGVAKVLTRST